MNGRRVTNRTMSFRFGARLATPCVLVLVTVIAAHADAPRVLPAGELPADARLGPLKDLNGYFPMVVPESVELWDERSEILRRQLLVSQGLWPMPTRSGSSRYPRSAGSYKKP